MVRVPAKSCPNLSRLFELAEPVLMTGLFNSRSFVREEWLNDYRGKPDGLAHEMLSKEPKERLGPLEAEAARIVEMSSERGQFALEGVAEMKLPVERCDVLLGQKDELARSLWTYVYEPMLFEAAENSLHMQLYRRYDRHYQTFMAEPSSGSEPETEADRLTRFLSVVGKALNRGKGYNLDRFDIPSGAEMPAAELYLIFHPKPSRRVRELSEDGELTNLYVRTPGEAAVFYFPSTGRVHVRAGSRALRHLIAESFIQTVLDQPISSQPVDFQAYDIRRFRQFADLPRPSDKDVVIETAKVIKIEVSIENLGNRLAISTTADGDLKNIVEKQSSLQKAFNDAVATRFVEFAVRYRRKDQDSTRILNFTVTDRNTCSLLSVEDPFERVLGHRLLLNWGISREGRAPTAADSMQALPALLALWEIGAEKVSGAWLVERGADAGLLIDVGFLVPAGAGEEDEREEADVLDEEDNLGSVAAQVVTRPEGPTLRVTPGREAPAGSPERYVVYRVRKGWVAQHLRSHMAKILGDSEPARLDDDLVQVGQIEIDNSDVPIYLARGLSDERTRDSIDSSLWARKDGGVGLVLQAGDAPGSSISGNVLTRVIDHLKGDLPNVALDISSLRDVYRKGFELAHGGKVVDFVPTSTTAGTLFVPGNKSIFISGEHRVQVINKLVAAYRVGRPRVTSDELRQEINDQSLSNIFGKDLWKRLQDGFVRSPKRPLWEIAY